MLLDSSRHFTFQCMKPGSWAYLHKEDEMLEGGVEVGFLLKLHDRVKMLVVNMSVDSEQTLQDSLGH